ncbi:MAG: TetR/AcrR family transcriptional regulator [Chloroflexota bacterium]
MTDVQQTAVLTEDVAPELDIASHRSRGPFGTPPGRQLISREFVLRHQRTRIIQGLAEEVVEKGYRDVTVASIVKRAGVARNTFYDSFANKEECFLAASDLAGEEAMRRIREVLATAPPGWPERVRVGLQELLAFVAGESALARVFVVESLSAGPAAAERYERAVRAVVPFFRLGRRGIDHGESLPATLEETIVGGIFWVVYQRIVSGRPDELEGLLGEIVEFALTPYLGVEAARELAAPVPA